MKRAYLNSDRGFTLVETLLSFCVSLMIISSLGVFGTIKLALKDEYIDNTMHGAIYQIANTLITARNITCGATLEFEDGDGDINRIFLDGNSLVKTPGYVIYTNDISFAEFFVEDNLIFLEVEKKGIKHIFLIGCDYPVEVEDYENTGQ